MVVVEDAVLGVTVVDPVVVVEDIVEEIVVVEGLLEAEVEGIPVVEVVTDALFALVFDGGEAGAGLLLVVLSLGGGFELVDVLPGGVEKFVVELELAGGFELVEELAGGALFVVGGGELDVVVPEGGALEPLPPVLLLVPFEGAVVFEVTLGAGGAATVQEPDPYLV